MIRLVKILKPHKYPFLVLNTWGGIVFIKALQHVEGKDNLNYDDFNSGSIGSGSETREHLLAVLEDLWVECMLLERPN